MHPKWEPECLAERAAGSIGKNSDLSGHLIAVARTLSEPLDMEPNLVGLRKHSRIQEPQGGRGTDFGAWMQVCVYEEGSLLSSESGRPRSKVKTIHPILSPHLRGNTSEMTGLRVNAIKRHSSGGGCCCSHSYPAAVYTISGASNLGLGEVSHATICNTPGASSCLPQLYLKDHVWCDKGGVNCHCCFCFHPLIFAQPPGNPPPRQADSFNLFLPVSEFVAATGMVNRGSEGSEVRLLEEEREG